MARKNYDDGDGQGEWLNTYADMVTLLLTFFVLMYGMSSVDSGKWQSIVQAFTRPSKDIQQIVLVPGDDGVDIPQNAGENGDTDGDLNLATDYPNDFDELYLYLKKHVEENNLQGSIELAKQENSVFIRFNDNIFFNPDSYNLKKDSLPLLNFMGDCFKNIEDQILVICINGHTAEVDIPNYPVSARRLSSQRADSVALFLEEDKWLDGKKIISRGYGSHFPIDTNDTPEGRTNNRRVDMTIISNEGGIEGTEQLFSLINGEVEINDILDTREPLESFDSFQSIQQKPSNDVDVSID